MVKPGGLVYSELPFMQQVHEGAYDFTRFSLAGHRTLLRQFEEIEAGMIAGPATTCLWSLEYLAMALAGGGRTGRIARGVVRCGFFWLKYLDFLLKASAAALDGASCTYFFGRKAERETTDLEILKRYRGARPLLHI